MSLLRYVAAVENFNGRVAVVTGAAHGIGRALADAFHEAGAKVVIADLDTDALQVAAGELRAAGAEVLAVPTDVSSWQSVEALAHATADRFGAAHVVCNNAGITTNGIAVADLSLADWSFAIEVNLWGVIHGIRAFLPILLQQDEGHIANTASSAALVGLAYGAPYSATKAAVMSISESLYREMVHGGLPIGVSVILPNAVLTTITRSEERRPERLKAPASRDNTPAWVEEVMGQTRGAGIAPAEAAQRILRGIRDGSYYIFTHESNERLASQAKHRAADIAERRNPRVRPRSML